MLALRDQIGSNVASRASGGHNQNFRGPCQQIDGAVGTDQSFGGGDITIARPENLIHARNRSRAVGERGNGLRAADMRDFLDPQQIGRREQRRIGLGTRDHDAAYAGNLRGYRRHQQRRNQRKTAARDVTADGFERLDALADAHSGLDDDAPRSRPLLFGNAANVPRGMREGCAQLARNLLRRGAAVPRAHPQRLGRKPHAGPAGEPS